jgi:hypothetical protein
MSNKYFDKFPSLLYNGNRMINITDRVAILNNVIANPYSFYPYVVKNGMRAEVVANKYYGDQDYVWLVYLSNNIVDPYHQWPKSDPTLFKFIEAEYGSLQAAQQKVMFYRVNWYENAAEISTTAFYNLQSVEKKYWEPVFDQYNRPLHYKRKRLDHMIAADEDGNISTNLEGIELTYWSSVSAYDYEVEKNADKAMIRLLDNRLADIAKSNLADLLSNNG